MRIGHKGKSSIVGLVVLCIFSIGLFKCMETWGQQCTPPYTHSYTGVWISPNGNYLTREFVGWPTGGIPSTCGSKGGGQYYNYVRMVPSPNHNFLGIPGLWICEWDCTLFEYWDIYCVYQKRVPLPQICDGRCGRFVYYLEWSDQNPQTYDADCDGIVDVADNHPAEPDGKGVNAGNPRCMGAVAK